MSAGEKLDLSNIVAQSAFKRYPDMKGASADGVGEYARW